MEENNSPITIGKIFYVAFRRWKLFVPIALLITIIGALLVLFVYNPSKGMYTSTFSYSSIDLQQENYSDGSPFSYNSIISKSNLLKAKNKSESYDSIDVEKISSSNSVSISRNIDKDASSANKISYTLNIPSRFFKNNEQARSFVNDVVCLTLETDKEKIESMSVDKALNGFEELGTFEAQIKALSNQANNLVETYKSFTDAEDKSLIVAYSAAVQNKNAVENAFSDNNASSLNADISLYGFVKDYTNVNFSEEKDRLNQEKVDNNKQLQVYTDQINAMGSGASITTLPTKVAALTDRNAEIEIELNAIDSKIANKSKYDSKDTEYMKLYNNFVSRLDNYYTSLKNEVNNYKNFLNKLYVDDAEVTYVSTNIIKETGTIGIAIAIALPLIVGIVIGAATNLIVDRKKLTA